MLWYQYPAGWPACPPDGAASAGVTAPPAGHNILTIVLQYSHKILITFSQPSHSIITTFSNPLNNLLITFSQHCHNIFF